MVDVLLPSAYSCDLIFTGWPQIPQPGGDVYSRKFKILLGVCGYLRIESKGALQLTREDRVGVALEHLSQFTSIVIIKLGVNGAIAQSMGKRIHVQGIPTDVVDTTGAGDNFDCGFLYGLLHDHSLEDCLGCGKFCGSRSATVQGGWDASPTADHLEDYLKTSGE